MPSNKERLIKLINQANPYKAIPFAADNIYFKQPNPDVGDTWNTRITVVGIVGNGYRKEADVYYTRVSLAELGSDILLAADTMFDPQSLLDQLNFVKGTSLNLDDVVMGEIPPIDYDYVQLFTLVANPASLAWVGQLDIQLCRGIADDIINELHTYLHVTMPLREATY